MNVGHGQAGRCRNFEGAIGHSGEAAARPAYGRVRFVRIKGGIAVYPKQFDDIARMHEILAGLGLPPDIEREPDPEIE